MFEIDDLVWYRGSAGYAKPEAAIISGYGAQGHFASLARPRNGEYRQQTIWGLFSQFTSRACHLCGEPTAEPGCPLCPACAEEQEKRERDARTEAEQRRRPL